MTDPLQRIAESKQRERRRLAALPFAEKIRLMEKMRDREAAIIANREYSSTAAILDQVLLVRERCAGYGAQVGEESRDAGS